jgi:hypothetical protein
MQFRLFFYRLSYLSCWFVPRKWLDSTRLKFGRHPTFHMRAFLRFLGLLAALLFSSSHALYAFATLEHGRLVGSGSARIDYDSNIFLSHSQISDTVGTANGGVEYVRDSGIVTANAAVGVTALVFAQHSDQNTADSYFNGKLGYAPDDKSTLHAGADYRRSSIANEFVNARTQSNDLTLDGAFDYLATEKLGLRALADYASSDYITAGYSDTAMYDVGLYVLHIYSPKLKLLAGATHLESWTAHRATTGSSPATSDWRYAVGAEGEVAPKITGNVNLGVTRHTFKHTGFNDSTDFYLSTQLSWAAAEKTTWNLLASRSLGVTAADQSVKAFDASLQIVQGLSEKMSVEASVGWEESSFQGYLGRGNRNDHGYTLRGRINYVIVENVSCDLSAGYRDNSSNLLVSTYDRFNIGAGISVRF